MNSFQIDQLAGQIYAMAGMETKLHLLANEAGDYNGRSVSFSGEGFANMKFIAHVVTQDQFNQWVKQTQRAPQKLTLSTYTNLAKATKDTSPMVFSSVVPNLFNTIMMKYMMPPQVSLQKDKDSIVPPNTSIKG
jgi:cytochrome o ubiquinol oxidase subunit 2